MENKHHLIKILLAFMAAGALGSVSAAVDPQCLNRCESEYMQCLAVSAGPARMQCDIQRDLCLSRCKTQG